MFFDNPKTATMVTTVAFAATNLCGFYAKGISTSGKYGLCLLSPACYTSSLPNLIEYEVGLIGVQWDNVNEETEGVKFAAMIGMMAFDMAHSCAKQTKRGDWHYPHPDTPLLFSGSQRNAPYFPLFDFSSLF
ncbi:MAG: hypothetical protein GY950_33955 [bacterium]|nr:hypothetical protein [bacterium]